MTRWLAAVAVACVIIPPLLVAFAVVAVAERYDRDWA